MRRTWPLGLVLLCGALAAAAQARAGVDETADPVQLVRERDLEGGPGYSAYLVSYRHAGLKLYAMVAVPEEAVPADGFPVLVANHGYVPDPRGYGIGADGRDSRPGDYYRSIPGLYARRGFLVVLPDYRGHNSSEGYEQIAARNFDAVDLYAEDVVALLALLDQLEYVDAEQIFMWSHSMGGDVALRVLLATDVVTAASVWSTTDVADLASRLAGLQTRVILHHATGDPTTRHVNSAMFAAGLHAAGIAHEFHSYESIEHFFSAEVREKAADRDAAFFLP